MEDGRIIQIMPADGWYSVYINDDDEAEVCSFIPLVGWALVESKGYTRVAGLDTSYVDLVDLCEDASNFSGYVREYQFAETKERLREDIAKRRA